MRVEAPQDHIAGAKAALAVQHATRSSTWTIETIDHRPNHVRGGRSILRATSADADPVILKIYERADHARLRYQTLARLREATAQVVTPLFLSEPNGLFAMEDAGRATLADELPQTDGDAVTRRGMDWLDHFCKEAPAAMLAFDPEPALADTERHLAHLPGKLDKKRRACLDGLAAAFAPFDGRAMRHCTIFGDMKPENLCITPDTGRLIGVDYVSDRRQPIARHAAFWLQWMRQRNWRRALRKTGWIEPHDEVTLRTTALEVLGDQLDPLLLDAYLQMFLIQLWARIAAGPNEPRLRETVEARLGL